MIPLGDITAVNGYALPPVDVVTGGSPCQDVSAAGVRKGIRHRSLGDTEETRSGLFMEQIRVIRELRNADRKRGREGALVRPRFMLWENVPGAFTSNQGRDFKAVLEETIRLAEPDAPDIPHPARWPMADAYFGDGWSVAYRVFDAQFWGVPQRRRRICLVADFGGRCAGEILFVRESVPGNPEPNGAAGTGTSRSPESRADSAGRVSGSDSAAFCIQGNIIARDAKMNGSGISGEPMFTLNTVDRHAVYDARGNGDGKTVCTMTSSNIEHLGDYTPIVTDCAAEAAAVDCRSGTEGTVNGTLQAKESGGYSLNTNNVVRQGNRVRLLTPLECERLQGFPDGYTDIGTWTDSKGRRRECSDSARYRALGNSIALPPWKWVLKRIAAQYERDATLGSLFDGIGGFPFLWEQLNGKGSALWASEIAEFPAAVTRYHFGKVKHRKGE